MTQLKIKLGSNQPLGLWRKDWQLTLLLVIVAMLTYLPAWNGTPISDDDAHLTKQELRSLQELARIWTQPSAWWQNLYDLAFIRGRSQTPSRLKRYKIG